MPRSGPGPIDRLVVDLDRPRGRHVEAGDDVQAASTCRSPTTRPGTRTPGRPPGGSRRRWRGRARRLVRNSFTRSVTTSFGGRGSRGRRARAVRSRRPRRLRTVTIVPTATPGCATSAGRGRWRCRSLRRRCKTANNWSQLIAAPEHREPVAEAVGRRQQLGDHEHGPRRREVDPGDVDRCRARSAAARPAACTRARPAPSVYAVMIISRGTSRATSAIIRMLKKTVPTTTSATLGASSMPSQRRNSGVSAVAGM